MNVMVCIALSLLLCSCTLSLELLDHSSSSTEIDVGPVKLELEGPTPAKGNSESNFVWTLKYSGTRSIDLKDSHVTLKGSDTSGCTMTLGGSGSTRTVTVTGCSGDGTVGIDVAANTAIDSQGNLAEAPASDDQAMVSSAVPTQVFTAPSSLQVYNDIAPLSHFWKATFAGVTEIPLKSSDVVLSGDTQGCNVAVAEVHNDPLSRFISLTNCEKSSGTVTMSLPKGSGKNDYGTGTIANTAVSVTLNNKRLVSWKYPSVVLEYSAGTSPQSLEITLSDALSEDLVIDYAPSAVTTAQHNLARGQVTIPAGQRSATISYETYGSGDGKSKFINVALQGAVTASGKSVAVLEQVARRTIKGSDTSDDSYAQVAISQYHACAIVKNSGELRCWGKNSDGQLGDNTTTDRKKSVVVDAGVAYESVAAGGDATCAIVKGTGKLKCWGYGGSGQLGQGVDIYRSTVPVDVDTVPYKKVVIGYAHTCGILKDTEEVKCWGQNSYGQLGRGNYTESKGPVAIDTGVAYENITAGWYFNCGTVKASGALKCWGANYYGHSGLDSSTSYVLTPTIADSGKAYKAVAAGSDHACGILTTGALKCWGYNGSQGGDGTYSSSNIKPTVIDIGVSYEKIVTGDYFSCAKVQSSDQWKCWGQNVTRYPDGSKAYGVSPVPLKTNTAFESLALSSFGCGIIKTSGEIRCWGDNGYGQIGDGTSTSGGYPIQLTPVVTDLGESYESIASDSLFNCGIVKGTGVVKCWGSSTNAMGDGIGALSRTAPIAVDGNVRYRKISVSSGHACGIVKDTDALRCWGNNSYGQLGVGATPTSSNVALNVDVGVAYETISVGDNHTCGIVKTTGELKCWGQNSYSAVGKSSGTAKYVLPEKLDAAAYSAVSAGYRSTCAIVKTTGVLKCWGKAFTTTSVTLPTVIDTGVSYQAVSVSSGSANHACGILTTGRVKCWGTGTSGQLGAGTLTTVTTPALVADTDLYSGINVKGTFSCGLIATTGVLKCWGNNGNGQLGLGDTVTRNSPTVVQSGISFAAISPGSNHACAIVGATGTLQCWGTNGMGSLGMGAATSYVTPVLAP
ncbi:RCC1 domain-containing protein [Bdellovibrio sp. HCB274]|uniref:RCC1 domain-containing protein n=1 Tax=Bdellovibrio sp. HCB274 TaxID=3394361 RepID=UPI0039B6B3B4